MAKKRVAVLLTLLLSSVLILPCFVGCGNAPKEKDCPEMLDYSATFIPAGIYSCDYSIKLTISLRRDVGFECRAIGEDYFLNNRINNRLKEVTIKSGETIALDTNFRSNEKFVKMPNGYYTIIAKESTHIVGYAVLRLKVVPHSIPDGWKLQVIKSVEFPKIGGQYQDVSEEYVQRQFKKLIKQ